MSGGLSQLDTSVLQAMGDYATPAAMGMARLVPCFAWLPWLAAGALPSRLLRVLVALVVLIGLWPVTETWEQVRGIGVAWGMGREAIVGTILGLLLALPFLVFHAIGSLVDTQRGAGVGAMLDPFTGVEATELANLMQMASVVVFLLGGGMLPLLEVLQQSYALVPMGSDVLPDLGAIHGFVGIVLVAALRMAAPVLLLLFLVDVLLGVLSRFAQQLNAFSVALAVKSLLAFLALLLYLMQLMADQVPTLWHAWPALRGLQPWVAG